MNFDILCRRYTALAYAYTTVVEVLKRHSLMSLCVCLCGGGTGPHGI